MMANIGILTSGGDAPGMNAAIRAVVKTANYYNCKVFGIQRGFQGLLNSEVSELSESDIEGIIHKGGSILKSSRCEEFKTIEGRLKAIEILKNFNIDSLIVIGGDGTFTGAKKLTELGFPVIGIPGTIDNDLAYTDYTIGFNTALNTIIESIEKIEDTSSSHEKVSIIEVMGRQCGDLALYAGIAGGVKSIIIPETDLDVEAVCKSIEVSEKMGKKDSIIILAEGAGNAFAFKKQMIEKLNIDIRVTVLGFIQRGGSPSAGDRILASRLGVRAVELLLIGKTSRVVGIKNNKIIDVDIEDALSKVKELDEEIYKMVNLFC